MLKDYETLGEFEENYRYCHDYWAPFVRNAQVYTLAASGYTWSDQELKSLAKEGREPLELNIMRRPLQFFSGYLRDNLNSVVVSPVEGSDQKTADQFTKLQYHVWDKGGGYNTFLDACDEGFKSGMSLCGIQMDYSRDFINGEISFFKRTYNSFYLDPTFEKLDLSDCAFAITRDLLDRNLVKQLLPFVEASVIDDIHGSVRDNKFLSYHPNFTQLSRNRNLMAYDQYYRRITKRRKFLVDEDAGFHRDVTDLPATEMERLKIGMSRIRRLHDEAEELGIEKKDLPALIDFREVDREFVELNIMLNGQRVYCGEDKTGITKTYPFAPVVCYMEPSIWMPSQRIQGIASTLWSAQRQFNKRHMKIIDMMDTTISTGYKYLIGSVPDPQDMQQSGQNKIIGVDPENAPEGLNSVQELNGGSANPALIEYQGILDQLTLTLSNVNESVLGVDEGGNTQVSGRLAQVRIAQGLRSNRKIFDNVEVTQKILGGLVLEAIQNNYSPGKVKRILGEEPTAQFYEKDFEQYDAVLKEGVRSQSQRDAYYYELVNLKREGIVDVPQEEIARMLPIAGTSDLQAAIEKQQEQQKQQQEKVNAQEELGMKLGNAEVEQKLALAQERRARVISDIALSTERASESEENRAQAALARAKTITEIADMETDRLLRVAEFVRTLEEQETVDRELVDNKIHQQADQINSETSGSMENQQVEAMNELNLAADQMNQQ
jgi:hypothetical protein